MPQHASAIQKPLRNGASVLPQVERLDSRLLLANGPALLGGVGVLGDSFADEYQFYPAARQTAKNFVEQLAEDRGLLFGNFAFQPRPEPRNAGFAFNYARDSATTTQMLAQGQHTGLAEWAAGNAISHAFIFVGGNDVFTALGAPNPTAALAAAPGTAAANINTAVSTLLAANPNLRVVVATVTSASILPAVQAAVAEGELAQSAVDAADAAVASLNGHIRAIADSNRQVAIADMERLEQRISGGRRFRFGGIPINREIPSDVPTHLFLSDGIHAGTVGQGLIANQYIRALRQGFGDRIRPLSNREILENAGLSRRGRNTAPAPDPNPSPDTPFFPRPLPTASIFSTLQIANSNDVLE